MKEQTSIDLKQLAKLTLFDENGIEHSLETFWQKQPAALVFVRHFG